MTNIISTGIPPTGLGISDEFESSTLNARWTESTVGTTTRDIHTSWPSNYFTAGDGTADQSRSLECSLTSAAGNALSITACCRAAGFGHNLSTMIEGIYLATDGTYTDYVALVVSGRSLVLQRMVASTPTDFGTYTVSNLTGLFLHIQRSAGNVWKVGYSSDNYAWVFDSAATVTLSQAVGKLKLVLRNNNSGRQNFAGWDWVRQDWLTL